jgi:F-type H+-transporting ATPase subunit c
MLSQILDPAMTHIVHPLVSFIVSFAADVTTYGEKAGKSIGLGAGAGGGAAGAGAGIGVLFGHVIESITRQPEMRDEITSIQWLGFALTEACFFYGLVGGFIAFFL